MFEPSLGRWIQEDPLGFDGGDVNLNRALNDNPVNVLDPMGTEAVSIEPRIIEGGVGDPPDRREQKPPTVIRGKTPYFSTLGQWDIVPFTKASLNVVVFKDQKSTSKDGAVAENVEVRAWGIRRFPDGNANDSGDHVALVVVQIRFLKGKCTDPKGNVASLPDRWKTIGFSLNHGVFLRGVAPSLEAFGRSMVIQKDDTWETFVDRFISGAQALQPGKK
jgi:hypothetical protein